MEDHGTLTQMAAVLAAAFIGGTLVQKLRQPVLVGYILVGILLGQGLLGVMTDEHQIMHLAELGILLLLFIVGIELDLKKFAPVYKMALITTCCQIGFAVLAMIVIGWMLEWPMTRIIILSFALSLSSTAVALRLLQDSNEIDTDLGRTVIGILVAQDIAVIPMLLIVSTMGGGEMNPGDLFKIFAALGFMGWLIWFLTHSPHHLTRWVESVHSPSQLTVMALAFCFTAAAISGSLGLSTAYGAFLAGLIIGNTSDGHSFEKTIRPIFDILIMVFFLSIGLLIDLEFIMSHFWSIMLLLGVTMAIKTLVNIVVLHKLGLARHQSFVAGAVLGQIGEFSFVLAALGLSSGSIMGDAYKYVVSVIALSLAITPVWLFCFRRLGVVRRFNLVKRMAGKGKHA